eukprot:m.251153 g.251153  ORF g.251153 m.251153 type:complete len:54 (-) comp17182_c5_seq2:444-605(-)
MKLYWLLFAVHCEGYHGVFIFVLCGLIVFKFLQIVIFVLCLFAVDSVWVPASF